MKRQAIEQGMFFGLSGDPGLVAHLVAMWESCSDCRRLITNHVVGAEEHRIKWDCLRSWSEVIIDTPDWAGGEMHSITTTCDGDPQGLAGWPHGSIPVAHYVATPEAHL